MTITEELHLEKKWQNLLPPWICAAWYAAKQKFEEKEWAKKVLFLFNDEAKRQSSSYNIWNLKLYVKRASRYSTHVQITASGSVRSVMQKEQRQLHIKWEHKAGKNPVREMPSVKLYPLQPKGFSQNPLMFFPLMHPSSGYQALLQVRALCFAYGV